MATKLREGSLAHDERALDTCGACSIGQECCRRLQGLQVTHAEYDRLFKAHEPLLTVSDRGSHLMIESVEGEVCPNWDGKCAVYLDRPIECRLFPYTLDDIDDAGSHVNVYVHTAISCPGKAALMPSVADMADMVHDFIDDTPLAGKPVAIRDLGGNKVLAKLRNLTGRTARRLADAIQPAVSSSGQKRA